MLFFWTFRLIARNWYHLKWLKVWPSDTWMPFKLTSRLPPRFRKINHNHPLLYQSSSILYPQPERLCGNYQVGSTLNGLFTPWLLFSLSIWIPWIQLLMPWKFIVFGLKILSRDRSVLKRKTLKISSQYTDKNYYVTTNVLQTILFSLAELFEQRKGTEAKSPPTMKRHAELCQQILKTIIYDLIPSSPLFEQKDSKSWELITRLLLGITDNLLWSDKQNYLADDLSEILLNSLFFVLLQSRIYCDEIWKKFSSCFKSWCHRLKSVLVWGSVTVALNSKIASILYNPNSSDMHEIIFGMHSNEYRVIIEVKYANYCWSRLTSNK